MRCPTLKELPAPLEGKTGWPWTEETISLPDVMPDGRPWPKISVITPNYNFVQFIEEAIRSILLQGYPNIEYIIIDGGSQDGSVDIIKKYEKWLAYWESSHDRGAAEATNKGLLRITGQIFNWVDSDNALISGSLNEIALLWSRDPCSLICGSCVIFDEKGKYDVEPNMNLTVKNFTTLSDRKLRYYAPGVWVPFQAISKVGQLDISYIYYADWEWMIRLLGVFPVKYSNKVFAKYRQHPQSKGSRCDRKFRNELRVICETYIKKLGWQDQWPRLQRWFDLGDWFDEIDKIRNSNSGRLRKAGIILIKALSNFDRLKSRFTWGALRMVLLDGQ